MIVADQLAIFYTRKNVAFYCSKPFLGYNLVYNSPISALVVYQH